ncbi:hypothetical protein [Neobacillus niacini]|uniref:hypothetical protein n=1 Tax=Neobacillus niacini TaxID=86668 RepID=UPI00203FAA1E|nr:hypothetical protein [Neobacillus niacini]MCM3692152.1 hypothetical protein [Neobacillus niacini]
MRIAENTCGWRKILADSRKYLRIAENTCGWREILADKHKNSCRIQIGSSKYQLL